MTKCRTAIVVVAATAVLIRPTFAQTVTGRGFVDGRGTWFPQDTANDSVNAVADLTVRAELFVKPRSWVQTAAGIDLRANSHDQTRRTWQIDWLERGRQRSALSVRRLSATLTASSLTLDIGKQFIRWGKTDIVTPTDRFAPRDFLNVIDNEFLPVVGARAAYQWRNEAFEAAWVPRFTPSRTPLLNQRWTAVPPVPVVLTESRSFPSGSQIGLRWGRTSGSADYAFVLFNGFNHLPTIDPELIAPGRVNVTLEYPQMRMYGGDVAVPTAWFILKGEAGYHTTSSTTADEYFLYVVQLERQTGEWLLIGGYAGELVVERRAQLDFAADRGLTKAITGRAALTIDTNRSAAFEGAVRQNGDGLYLKGEYSQAAGQHWRTTVAGTLIRGKPDDFLGQYRRNSNVSLALRYSF